MITRSRVKALAGLSLLAVLAACASPAPPPPPPVAYIPPPITLSPRVVEQAAAYRGYVQSAGAISPNFADGLQVAQAVKTGSAYESRQLMSGAVAYAAVVALQDPAFVSAVREFAADRNQRTQVAQQILRDPAYAAVIKGADTAAGLIISALGTDGTQVYMAGRAVKQAAYDVQRQKWSKADVANRPERLAEAKALSARPHLPSQDETARLHQVSTGLAPLGLTPTSAPAPYSPLVIRGLAVAALAALGEAGDAHMATIQPLLAEPTGGQCLNLAKLNLYQCLAVSKPHYEDVFCVGQHILMDTGQCLIKSSGAAMPYIPPPPVPVKAEVKTPAKKKAPAKKKG
ncbi:hypothetical protein [Caulobacter sp. NIBR2454]|uniref:hypothetical protein n=1 Tax=Caulobacter sp. NIBR2454 TaxID=3015996 RepID=UPI0022B62D3A|nr:hypothetical protein [Caulobacter sp. NIBR2454]